jgi:hypothetical protein
MAVVAPAGAPECAAPRSASGPVFSHTEGVRQQALGAPALIFCANARIVALAWRLSVSLCGSPKRVGFVWASLRNSRRIQPQTYEVWVAGGNTR